MSKTPNFPWRVRTGHGDQATDSEGEGFFDEFVLGSGFTSVSEFRMCWRAANLLLAFLCFSTLG